MADESERSTNINQKVLQYEEFIDKRLKKDLEAVYKAQEEVYSKINEHMQLKTTIIQLKKSRNVDEKKDLKTMVDIGNNFYCQASVPDTSMINVAVGYGFYVQFTLDEALVFIEKKCVVLNNSAEKLSKEAAKIKANMKVVLGGLQDLQQLGNIGET